MSAASNYRKMRPNPIVISFRALASTAILIISLIGPQSLPAAPRSGAVRPEPNRDTPSPNRDAPPPKKQKPASELISKQAQPKVVPRVMNQANPNNTHVVISIANQRVYLMVGDEIAIDSPISSGKRAGMTPTGRFVIVQKNPDHRSNIYGSFVNRAGQVVRSGVSTRIDSAPSGTTFRGAPMQYFMRFGKDKSDWSAVGMHVGVLPGYPASHGCVRLPADIAPLIYERVKVGTSVTINP